MFRRSASEEPYTLGAPHHGLWTCSFVVIADIVVVVVSGNQQQDACDCCPVFGVGRYNDRRRPGKLYCWLLILYDVIFMRMC